MAQCSTYGPGFSEAKNALDAYIERDTRTKFYDLKHGTIGRLSQKVMGDQNGICPTEEVYSLSTVEAGSINDLECGGAQLLNEVQTGLDCNGNAVGINTKGGNASHPLCGSNFGGSFAVGVDAFKPQFYTYERRFPTICVDAGSAMPKEAKGTLRAIKNDGAKMVLSDLDFLMWDLVTARGTGNSSIDTQVVLGSRAGLTNGEFPSAPKSHLNHNFMKEIQRVIMADPENWNKKFYVEASSLQIDKAVEDHQNQIGIQRQSMSKVEDPYRTEEVFLYYGIYYVKKEMAHYVGLVDTTNGKTIIRPRMHVHQAGTEYGLVVRPNYTMHDGCTINCDGNTYDKVEVAQWYLEESVFYVPFRAPMDIPTSGREEIKDNVYASPAAFKSYWVKDHAVETPGDCPNDRGQFQQMGMRTVFGLYNRPDRIDHGSVLLSPVNHCIVLANQCCPEDQPPVSLDPVNLPDRNAPSTNGCEPCDGSSDTDGGGEKLSGPVTLADPNPDLEADVPGSFRFKSLTQVTKEEDNEIQFLVGRVGGSNGAAAINYATADGTAVDGTNYTNTNGTLNWADGETGYKKVIIPLIDDDIAAAVEFTLVLSGASGAAAPASDTATATIEPTPA